MHHVTGTAKMGPEFSVVDANLRVYGVKKAAHRRWFDNAEDYDGEHAGALRDHR
jgi:GMC oxidoreductase